MALPDDYIILGGYPALITDREWQKKKKFKDKLRKVTKTGLGAELIKAEAAYKKIKFDLLDAKMQGKWPSGDAIVEGKERAEDHYARVVKPAITIFLRASKKAHLATKNAALSKQAQTAAAAISKELMKHVAAWNSIEFDDFDEALDRWRQGIARWRQRLDGNVDTLEGLIDALADDPKLDNWDNTLTQAFRSVGNSLGNNPEFKDLWPIWKPWDGLQKKNLVRRTKKAETEALNEHIAEVRQQIEILKGRLG
jgi:hypothetical protein